MYLKTFFIVACIFSSCAKRPAHVKNADNVTKSFNEMIVREKSIFAIGSGGYFNRNKVDALYADYEVYKPYSREEARELLVATVNEFVQHINQNEAIRPHLAHYPISVENVSISMAFVDKKHNPFDSLAQIHLYGGKIFYSSYDKEKKAFFAFDQEVFPTENQKSVEGESKSYADSR